MKEKVLRSYAIRVKGESLTDWSGAVPESIDPLLEKPGKEIARLRNLVITTQVELLCQQGKTADAMEILDKYSLEERRYKAPLCTFKRDHQDGQSPYQGAHCFYGAFRDASGGLFEIYYKKKEDRGIKASDKHLRDCVRVIPNHIFFYRDGKKILTPDAIEDQQPTEGVPGFARYEVIHHPFSFGFVVRIIIAGPFKTFLADTEKVLEALHCSTFNGQGARRSAGHGGWRIIEAKVEDWLVTQE